MKKRQIPLDNIKQSIVYFRKQQSLLYLPFKIIIILLQYICSHILHILIGEEDKKEKKIVGFSNIYYNGNPRAVFEWIQKYYSEKYEIFWVAKNLRTLKDVKKSGGKVFHVYSILGLPYFLKTDVWVLAHTGIGNLPFLSQKNFKKIQLWHGVGYKGHKHSRSRLDYVFYDAWCTSSPWTKKRHIKLWDAPIKKLFVTGYARLDRLCHYINLSSHCRKKVFKEIGISSERKIIFYAPTYGMGLWPWNAECAGFEKFCKFCASSNLTLVIRLHPYAKSEKKILNQIIKNYQNIYLLNMDQEPDTMKILSVADVLITDWSSIATDFLVTKKPIIFMDVDKNRFVNEKKGEGIIPQNIRPGEKVTDEDEFFYALEICLEKNRFKEKQEKMLSKIHGNVDGKSSERVVKIIEYLIKNE